MKSKYIEGFVTGLLSAVLVLVMTVAVLTVVSSKTAEKNEQTETPTEQGTVRQTLNTAELAPTVYAQMDKVQQLVESGVLVDVGDEASYETFEKELRKMLTYIHLMYYDEVDDARFYDNMLHMLMASVDDPYAAYYDREELQELMSEDSGSYSGIGATISQNYKTMEMKVLDTYSNSPALEAGMCPGDVLLAVDGESVVGMYLNDTVKLLKGPEGTTVIVTVAREGVEEPIELTIVRKHIDIEYVSYRMLQDNIGYLAVTEFAQNTADQFSKACKALKDENMQGLIIDLRGNGGGYVYAVEEMLNMIAPNGALLFYTEDKYGNRVEYNDKTAAKFDIPIVVLVDGNTASASEIMTGFLKDSYGAKVVGTKTFGKGIVQTTFMMLDTETAVKITTDKYFIPSGVCIHETGIEPDVAVELDEELKQVTMRLRPYDNQIDAAVEQMEMLIK